MQNISISAMMVKMVVALITMLGEKMYGKMMKKKPMMKKAKKKKGMKKKK